MKNYSSTTTNKGLEYASWAGMGISLALMIYSALTSASAMGETLADYDNYLFLRERSREVFMHSSLMMVFSMMGLFVSNISNK
jgi:hypothetical protein